MIRALHEKRLELRGFNKTKFGPMWISPTGDAHSQTRPQFANLPGNLQPHFPVGPGHGQPNQQIVEPGKPSAAVMTLLQDANERAEKMAKALAEAQQQAQDFKQALELERKRTSIVEPVMTEIKAILNSSGQPEVRPARRQGSAYQPPLHQRGVGGGLPLQSPLHHRDFGGALQSLHHRDLGGAPPLQSPLHHRDVGGAATLQPPLHHRDFPASLVRHHQGAHQRRLPRVASQPLQRYQGGATEVAVTESGLKWRRATEAQHLTAEQQYFSAVLHAQEEKHQRELELVRQQAEYESELQQQQRLQQQLQRLQQQRARQSYADIYMQGYDAWGYHPPSM